MTRQRRFYLPTDPAPTVRPPFMVVTASGAWACADLPDAVDLRDTLQGAGVHGKIIAQQVTA